MWVGGATEMVAVAMEMVAVATEKEEEVKEAAVRAEVEEAREDAAGDDREGRADDAGGGCEDGVGASAESALVVGGYTDGGNWCHRCRKSFLGLGLCGKCFGSYRFGIVHRGLN